MLKKKLYIFKKKPAKCSMKAAKPFLKKKIIIRKINNNNNNNNNTNINNNNNKYKK
jgi:hypothetical protein